MILEDFDTTLCGSWQLYGYLRGVHRNEVGDKAAAVFTALSALARVRLRTDPVGNSKLRSLSSRTMRD